jgi:cytochrome P450
MPERWLPDAREDHTSPFFNDQLDIIQTFSVGPRSCIGKSLAWAQMRLILSKLVWAFDIEAAKGHVLRWEELRTFSIVEKKQIRVKLTRRSL